MWREKSLVHSVSGLQGMVTGMQRTRWPQLEKYIFSDLVSWGCRQRYRSLGPLILEVQIKRLSENASRCLCRVHTLLMGADPCSSPLQALRKLGLPAVSPAVWPFPADSVRVLRSACSLAKERGTSAPRVSVDPKEGCRGSMKMHSTRGTGLVLT